MRLRRRGAKNWTVVLHLGLTGHRSCVGARLTSIFIDCSCDCDQWYTHDISAHVPTINASFGHNKVNAPNIGI